MKNVQRLVRPMLEHIGIPRGKWGIFYIDRIMI
nr:MAG TPA: hypothetical protein [Caudoviricetes sp.]